MPVDLPVSGQVPIALTALLAFALALRWVLWRAARAAPGLWRGALTRLSGSRMADRARPVRSWIRGRWPRTYRMVAGRLDPHRFDGLLLTLIVLAGGYMAMLFGGLVEEVFEAEDIYVVDHALLDMVAPWRARELVPVANWITDLGSMATLTAVALVATGFLWAQGKRGHVAAVWLTVIGSQVTTWAGKFVVDRDRPEFMLDVTAYSASFPSGHTTGALAVYGVVACVLVRDLRWPRARFEIIYWTAWLIALIAFSRVFLSVHYPSDVAAGFLVGGFWLLAGITLYELLHRRAAASQAQARAGDRASPNPRPEPPAKGTTGWPPAA